MAERCRSRIRVDDGETSDEELVEAAKSDRRAFSPLYRRYADPVYRFCYRRLQSQEAAEDVAATVFERALTSLPRFQSRGPGSFRSWLFTIAHHAITNSLRDRRGTSPLEDAVAVIDTAPGPEDTMQTVETHDDVWSLIASLPPLHQRILELRMAELTGREIAEVLGMSHGAVKAAQFRAFTRLRATLAVTTSDSQEPS